MVNPPPPKRASPDRSGSWCSSGTESLSDLHKQSLEFHPKYHRKNRKKEGARKERSLLGEGSNTVANE